MVIENGHTIIIVLILNEQDSMCLSITHIVYIFEVKRTKTEISNNLEATVRFLCENEKLLYHLQSFGKKSTDIERTPYFVPIRNLRNDVQKIHMDAKLVDRLLNQGDQSPVSLEFPDFSLIQDLYWPFLTWYSITTHTYSVRA